MSKDVSHPAPSDSGSAPGSLHAELEQHLEALEAALKAADLWRVEAPDAQALASQQPFCIDTMSLPAWCRYVLIARLRQLARQQGSLPAVCEVAPAMAAYLKQQGVAATDQLLVVRAVERLDRFVTDR